MNEVIRVLLACLAAIFAGVILGNGAVYFFNRIPGGWLCDYGQEPDEELLHPTVQRLRSTPWKYVFSGLFVVMAVWLAMRDPVYGVAALAAVWLLLVICGCGFIPFHEGGPLSGLWGALVGFGVMLLIGILGKLIYRKDTLGGGDIKLFGALGLCCGLEGIIAVFILTTLLSAGHLVYLLLRRRVKSTDQQPMVPYIALAAGIYLVLLHEIRYNIMILL